MWVHIHGRIHNMHDDMLRLLCTEATLFKASGAVTWVYHPKNQSCGCLHQSYGCLDQSYGYLLDEKLYVACVHACMW